MLVGLSSSQDLRVYWRLGLCVWVLQATRAHVSTVALYAMVVSKGRAVQHSSMRSADATPYPAAAQLALCQQVGSAALTQRNTG